MSERFRCTVSLPAPLGWSGLQVPRECLLEWGGWDKVRSGGGRKFGGEDLCDLLEMGVGVTDNF